MRWEKKGGKMDWKSVPKCGRPKQVLLELANDVTFFRGPSLYDRLAGWVQGRSGRGGPVEKRWNKKSPGPAHPCAAPATQASKQGCACMDGFGALMLLRNAMQSGWMDGWMAVDSLRNGLGYDAMCSVLCVVCEFAIKA